MSAPRWTPERWQKERLEALREILPEEQLERLLEREEAEE